MKKGLLFRVAVISVAAAAATGVNYAQDATKAAGQKSPSATQRKAPSKPHRVWTEDDLGSLRREGSISVAAAYTPTIPPSPDPAPAATPKQTQAGKPTAPGKPATLPNPKTVNEAAAILPWDQPATNSHQ